MSSATTPRSGWSSRWVLGFWCRRDAVACDGSQCCGLASKHLGGEGTELFGRVCMCSHPAYACARPTHPARSSAAQDGLDVPAFYAELPHTLRTGEYAGATGSSGWLRAGYGAGPALHASTAPALVAQLHGMLIACAVTLQTWQAQLRPHLWSASAASRWARGK